jgi:hypothetical protein
MQGFAEGYSAAAPAAGSSAKLMLFAGPGHRTYLGCLNCSEFATDSVLNKFGSHGSPYSTESIFNRFSQFGGQFGAYSPCNPYASDPPVIVDSQGNFYGRLTINTMHSQRTNSSQLHAWIAGVCAG